MNWQSETGRAALAECLKAYRAAVADAQRRDAGEVVDTPNQPTAPQRAPTVPAVKGHTVRDAFDAWCIAKPGRLAKTVKTYSAAADALRTLLPGRTLESLTREDGRDVVAALLRNAQAVGGKAQNTAINLLGRFKTLLAQAVDLEWITKSPLEGRTIEGIASDVADWKLGELATLFHDPLFTGYRLPTAAMAGKDAAYFLPVLGLFTGARISELAQLSTQDVQDTPAGLVLSIRPDPETGQRVKNHGSVRLVPVHSELIRLGFADYWRAIKTHGTGPLFPAIARTELNGAGASQASGSGSSRPPKALAVARSSTGSGTRYKPSYCGPVRPSRMQTHWRATLGTVSAGGSTPT